MVQATQLRRGSTAQHGGFTGLVGEFTIDTDKDTGVVHDGSTAGGFPLAREDLNNVAASSIISKLASQAVSMGALTLSDALTIGLIDAPEINLNANTNTDPKLNLLEAGTAFGRLMMDTSANALYLINLVDGASAHSYIQTRNGTNTWKFGGDGKAVFGQNATTAPDVPYGSAAQQLLTIQGNSNYPGAAFDSYSDSQGNGAMLILARSRGTTIGTPVETQNNDILGYLIFEGVNADGNRAGGAYIQARQIAAAGSGGLGVLKSRFEFYASNGTSVSRRMALDSDGLILDSIGVYIGGTAAANLLDDIEDGNWTAVVTDGANNATLSEPTCSYRKVKDSVKFSGYIILSSKGSISGSIRIAALPFTCASANRHYSAVSFGYGTNFSITGGVSVSGYVQKGAAYISLTQWSSSVGTSDLLATNFNSNTAFIFSGEYQAA